MMSARGFVRWVIDRVMIAFIIAVIVVNGSSFGFDLLGRGLLYTFEVFLVTVVVVGAVVYLVVPRSKSKKALKS